MKILTKQSINLINQALQENDIYHVSNLDPNVIRYEVAPHRHGSSLTSLRYNYLLNNIGLVSTINNYFSNTRRLFEYFANGNFANTLRQRLNITQTLVNCNGDTAVPVHISIGVRKNTGILDLDKFDFTCYYTVTHPGYTRASGSVFLNIPLKNVLIYIRKEHRIKFIDKPYLTQIKKPEDLLPYYSSLTGVERKLDFYLDFFMPDKGPKRDYRNNLKIHPPTDTCILKLNKMYPVLDQEFKIDLHPMQVYVENTFTSFDNLCTTLFSNNLTVYTNDPSRVKKNISNNFQNLLQNYFQSKDIPIRNLHTYLENHIHVPNFGGSAIHPTKSRIPDPLGKYKKLHSLKDTPEEDNIHLVDGNIKVVSIEGNENLQEIVKLNNFKGIAFVIQKDFIDYIDRVYYEFLYLIDVDNTVIRTEDSKVQIINCSHRYWQDGIDYKEVIVDNSFFTLK